MQDTIDLLASLTNDPDKDGEIRVQCQTTLPLAQSFEKRMRLLSKGVGEVTLKDFDTSGILLNCLL